MAKKKYKKCRNRKKHICHLVLVYSHLKYILFDNKMKHKKTIIQCLWLKMENNSHSVWFSEFLCLFILRWSFRIYVCSFNIFCAHIHRILFYCYFFFLNKMQLFRFLYYILYIFHDRVGFYLLLWCTLTFSIINESVKEKCIYLKTNDSNKVKNMSNGNNERRFLRQQEPCHRIKPPYFTIYLNVLFNFILTKKKKINTTRYFIVSNRWGFMLC